MKLAAKSCSCFGCRRGKGTRTGKQVLHRAEKAFRRACKQALQRGAEDLPAAPYAPYVS